MIFVHFSYRPPLADTWYSLSYVYFSLLGVLTTIVSGLLVSMITGEILLFSLYFKHCRNLVHNIMVFQLYQNKDKIEGVCIFFYTYTGGCKQDKMNSELFVRKNDLICFSWCNKSKVLCLPPNKQRKNISATLSKINKNLVL